MNKFVILMDSFSGFTKQQLKEMGIEMVSQTIIIDGELYKEGVEITKDNAEELMKNAKDIKSSMPAIGIVSKKLKELSNENENVLYITMNKGMSSTFSTGMAAAKEFKNVHVVNSGALIGSMLIEATKICKNLSLEGKGIDEIVNKFNKLSEVSNSYIVVKDTTNLINSGRIGATKKIIMEKVKLIPRLQVTKDGFKSAGTKRNFQKIIKSTVIKIIESIGGIENREKYSFHTVSTGSATTDTMVRGALNFHGIEDIKTSTVAAATLSYTGKGSFGIGVMPKK